MFGFKKKILGLDIGTRSIKGVLLSRKGAQVIMDNYFYVDLPEALGGPASPELVERVVADLVEGAGLRKALVASALEDKELQVVSLSLPPMPESDIRAAVINELEAQLNLDAKELAVDFTVAPPRNERATELSVQAFYTKMVRLKEHLDLLEAAQLLPLAVESAMHAALETARFNDYLNLEETCLLVDAGDSHTSVGLVVKGELVQVNTIRTGAGEINQQLMQQFGCTFENSELRKLAFRMDKEDAAEQTEAKTIEQGYYEIIVAIHDTATYFRASRKAQNIQRVILSGGGLMKEGAPALIEQSLGLPVTVVDPLRKIEIFGGKEGDRERLPRIGPMLHVAVGLALRGVA
jgi:type IV pilus assembly protein PilM